MVEPVVSEISVHTFYDVFCTRIALEGPPFREALRSQNAEAVSSGISLSSERQLESGARESECFLGCGCCNQQPFLGVPFWHRMFALAVVGVNRAILAGFGILELNLERLEQHFPSLFDTPHGPEDGGKQSVARDRIDNYPTKP